VNDDMARWIADTLHLTLKRRSLRVLILGVTFKEDVPDLRNSKVGDIVKRFWFHGHSVTVHDPYADTAEAERDYGVNLDPEALEQRYDLVVAAVSHRFYREMDDATLAGLVEEDGLFADVKGVFRGRDFGRRTWTL
jgi:UDP-N-acetyl-D-galactosamine dehydrogenase